MRHLVLTTVLLVACGHSRPVQQGSDFVAVYRWHVRPGCEARFVAAWEAETLRFRARWGSHGTRLFRADDGTFVATALWPSWAAPPA